MKMHSGTSSGARARAVDERDRRGGASKPRGRDGRDVGRAVGEKAGDERVRGDLEGDVRHRVDLGEGRILGTVAVGAERVERGTHADERTDGFGRGGAEVEARVRGTRGGTGGEETANGGEGGASSITSASSPK